MPVVENRRLSRIDLHACAKEIYERVIDVPNVEDGRWSGQRKFVAIDVDSEDFEIGATASDAIRVLKSRHDDTQIACGLLGSPESLVSANVLDRTKPTLPSDEVMKRGTKLFKEEIEPSFVEDRHGDHVAIDVTTGDYEIGRDQMEIVEELLIRRPKAEVWFARIGYDYSVRFGRHRPVTS